MTPENEIDAIRERHAKATRYKDEFGMWPAWFAIGAPDAAMLLRHVDTLTAERDEAKEKLGRVGAIGDIEGQASAWAAVWEKLWAAGMCSFLPKNLGPGRDRVLEFIDHLTAELAAAIERGEHREGAK